MLRRLERPDDDATAAALLAEADTDGDGSITFDEFVTSFKSRADLSELELLAIAASPKKDRDTSPAREKQRRMAREHAREARERMQAVLAANQAHERKMQRVKAEIMGSWATERYSSGDVSPHSLDRSRIVSDAMSSRVNVTQSLPAQLTQSSRTPHNVPTRASVRAVHNTPETTTQKGMASTLMGTTITMGGEVTAATPAGTRAPLMRTQSSERAYVSSVPAQTSRSVPVKSNLADMKVKADKPAPSVSPSVGNESVQTGPLDTLDVARKRARAQRREQMLEKQRKNQERLEQFMKMQNRLYEATVQRRDEIGLTSYQNERFSSSSGGLTAATVPIMPSATGVNAPSTAYASARESRDRVRRPASAVNAAKSNHSSAETSGTIAGAAADAEAGIGRGQGGLRPVSAAARMDRERPSTAMERRAAARAATNGDAAQGGAKQVILMSQTWHKGGTSSGNPSLSQASATTSGASESGEGTRSKVALVSPMHKTWKSDKSFPTRRERQPQGRVGWESNRPQTAQAAFRAAPASQEAPLQSAESSRAGRRVKWPTSVESTMASSPWDTSPTASLNTASPFSTTSTVTTQSSLSVRSNGINDEHGPSSRSSAQRRPVSAATARRPAGGAGSGSVRPTVPDTESSNFQQQRRRPQSAHPRNVSTRASVRAIDGLGSSQGQVRPQSACTRGR